MSVPNEFEFAKNVIGPRLKRLVSQEATRANSFQALNDGCHELRKSDGRWGLLEKTGGAQVRQRAADIWAYNLGDGTCQLVDVIGDAEGEDGTPRVTWGEVAPEHAGIRPIAQWKEPYADVVDPPVPPDPPQPPDDHAEILRRLAEVERLVWEAKNDAASARVEAETARALAGDASRLVMALGARVSRLKIVPDDSADPIGVSRSFGHGHTLRVRIGE